MPKPVLVFQTGPNGDDDQDLFIPYILGRDGFIVCWWNSNESAGRTARRYHNFCAVVICLGKRGNNEYGSGIYLLRYIFKEGPKVPCIVITPEPEVFKKKLKMWNFPPIQEFGGDSDSIMACRGQFAIFALENPLNTGQLIRIIECLGGK